MRLCCLDCDYDCVLFYGNFLSVLFYRAAIGVVVTICFIGLRFGLGDNLWLEVLIVFFILGSMLAGLLYPLTGSFYRASRYFVL